MSISAKKCYELHLLKHKFWKRLNRVIISCLKNGFVVFLVESQYASYSVHMTKFILAGGNDREIPGFAKALKQELPTNLGELSFLSCFFSRPEVAWETSANDWRQWVSKELGITNYDYARRDTFESKVQQADIVFFHGGDSWALLEAISKYDDFEKMLGGIIIGSSAGANLFAKNFWSASARKAGEGLGILDVNTMVHYGVEQIGDIVRTEADWLAEEQEFAELIGSSDILRLPEGTIQTFTK